ncbi:PRC-barrel domain containing protein [Rhodobacterales bacterium]|nr:PRC-barrel domain containing protein [Rhodobacterales bacterium]
MLRHLLASTALVAALSTGALAADNASMNKDANDQQAQGVMEFELHTLAPDATTGILASNMIGKYVMNGTNDDAESIGDINDVVINRDGEVRAVIVGVGGFLGIGEKDVAVDFDRLSFVSDDEDGDADGDEFTITTDVTQDELESAQAYERPDNMPTWMTTSAMREEMNDVEEGAKNAAQATRNEAVEAKEKTEQAMTSDDDWTAEKTPVDIATVSTDDLIGANVYVGQDDDIGEVSEVLIGDDNKATAVIIDVGGFLGFGEKPVVVSYDSLNLFETENGDLLVTAPFTREQLENAKTYEPAAYKENPDSVMLKG